MTQMGGKKGPEADFANPEQLFGMAYSTCFLSALNAVQGQTAGAKPLPKSTTVRALVSIGKDAKEIIPVRPVVLDNESPEQPS